MPDGDTHGGATRATTGPEIAARTLVQAGVVALVVLAVMLLLRASEAFFALFGGLLFAVLFNSTARWVQGRTGLPYRIALAISVLVPLALLGVGLWVAAPAVADQAGQLAERIPQATRQLLERLQQSEWTRRILEQQERMQALVPDGSDAAGVLGSFFASSFGAVGHFVIALAVGLFLAIAPGLYLDGVLRLVPLDKRARAREVLLAVRSALASWLGAKLTAMLVIGVLTTLGLWLIGIDLALVLGVVAALLSFIPNIGPIISLLPAALIALLDGPQTLLYVALLYAAIQALESYVLTPVLQQRMVDLPPALTLGVQVILGVVAGAMGLIFAAPLAAVGLVMIQLWYVQDLLGDRDGKTGQDGRQPLG